MNSSQSKITQHVALFSSIVWLLICSGSAFGADAAAAKPAKKAITLHEDDVSQSKHVKKKTLKKLNAEEKKKLAGSDKYREHNANDLTLDDRFESTLFAGPPYVEYVTAVSADIDGTVYVSVDQNGSLGHYAGLGSIITAKDNDGDGKADKFVNYVPNVSSPRGGHIVAGTYYLLHPPYLSAFTDTTGDGVADKKVLLAKGFGGGIEHFRGADHTTNGVRMGIDGWLYVAVGDFGMLDAKSIDGSVVQFRGGGVARMRPDGSELEVYVYHTRNQVDVAITPTLELFTRDNTNDGKGWNLRIHHQIAEADMGYPRLYQNFKDEHLASRADYGGGSGMGCLFLDEPGFPADLNNRLYTCDWTSNKVHKFEMTKNDATYDVVQKDFTKLDKASDIDVDGQSNLYLADWKGGRFSFAGEGVPISRIHVAKLKNYKAPPVPNLKKADEQTLLKHLLGPSAAIRLQAQQYLIKKGASSTGVNALQKASADKGESINVRVAALFTLKQLQGEASHTFIKGLLADASIRLHAMKALTDRKSQFGDLKPDLFANYLDDPNPKVRLQAAVSMRRLNRYSERSIARLIKMATGAWKKDSVGKLGTMALPHMGSRALSGLGQHHDGAWKQYLNAFRTSDFKTQKTLSYGLQTIHNPELIKELIQELGATRYNDQSRLVLLGILARLSHKEVIWNVKDWWGTRPADAGPYFQIRDWEMTAPILAAIEKNFTQFSAANQLEVLALLKKNQIDVSSLKIESGNALFAALEASAPKAMHIESLRSAALDKKQPWDVRTKAYKQLELFQEWKDAGAITRKKVKGKKPQTIVNEKRVKAAQALRLTAAGAVLEVLAQWQGELAGLDASSAEGMMLRGFMQDYWTLPSENVGDFGLLVTLANKVSDAAATFAWKKILYAHYRPVGIKAANAAKLIDSKEALHNAGYYQAIADMYLLEEKFLARAKANEQWDYKGTREAATAVVNMHRARGGKSKDLVNANMEKAKAHAMKNAGDVILGEALFNKQGCIVCHAINTAAEQKGPYLGTAGSQFPRDFIIDSILNPSAAMAQGFPTYVMTKQKKRGGQVHMGFMTKESNTHYTLMNMAGQTEDVLKENIETKETVPASQMPPGLVNALTLHEFTSLIEYLASMK